MTKVRVTYTTGATLNEQVLARIRARENQKAMKDGTLSSTWRACDARRRTWDPKLWTCSYAAEPDTGAERSVERWRTSGR